MCPGPFHDCPKSLTTGTVAITATFSAMNANLIFGTAETYPTNLGGTAPYDAACNSVASAAGINNSAGNGYIAMISDANSTAPTRLGTARGWVRLDGKPFGDTLASIFTFNGQIFYPFAFLETGQATTISPMTATTPSGGAFLQTCQNWTSIVDDGSQIICGHSLGGPAIWTDGGAMSCGQMGNLLCMGRTHNVTVSAPVAGAGRKIWQTTATFTPGGTTTPDALCQASRAPGVTTAVALIATTKKTAASLLVPTTSYYRLDGALVGTGALIASMGLHPPTSSSFPGPGNSRVGSMPLPTPGPAAPIYALGTTASTCADWTSSTLTAGNYGSGSSTAFTFWGGAFTTPCSSPFPLGLYCVQTAP